MDTIPILSFTGWVTMKRLIIVRKESGHSTLLMERTEHYSGHRGARPKAKDDMLQPFRCPSTQLISDNFGLFSNAWTNDHLPACTVLGTWLWSSIHLGCAIDIVQAAGKHTMKQHTDRLFAVCFGPRTFCWVHPRYWDGIRVFGVSVLLVRGTFHRNGE